MVYGDVVFTHIWDVQHPITLIKITTHTLLHLRSPSFTHHSKVPSVCDAVPPWEKRLRVESQKGLSALRRRRDHDAGGVIMLGHQYVLLLTWVVWVTHNHSQAFSNFFVTQARENSRKFPSDEELMDKLISNYNPIFTGKTGGYFDQEYQFAKPKKAWMSIWAYTRRQFLMLL